MAVTLAERVIVAGDASGALLVGKTPLSFWGGLDPATGEIIDRRHELSGMLVTDRVLVLPHGRGSCSASGVLLEAIHNRTGPAAIIVGRVDPIIGLGAILAEELYGLVVPVLVAPAAWIARAKTGQAVAIDRAGRLLSDEELVGGD